MEEMGRSNDTELNVSMYVHMCEHVYVCGCVCTCAYIHVCVYMCMYVDMCVPTYMYNVCGTPDPCNP